jgi:hypothetical protein
METMSLVGGIDMYSRFGTRYESDESPEGRKVFFNDWNGYDSDLEYANKFFKKGDVLTVKEIYVGRSSSQVEFLEHPNKQFNTVMFSDIKK